MWGVQVVLDKTLDCGTMWGVEVVLDKTLDCGTMWGVEVVLDKTLDCGTMWGVEVVLNKTLDCGTMWGVEVVLDKTLDCGTMWGVEVALDKTLDCGMMWGVEVVLDKTLDCGTMWGVEVALVKTLDCGTMLRVDDFSLQSLAIVTQFSFANRQSKLGLFRISMNRKLGKVIRSSVAFIVVILLNLRSKNSTHFGDGSLLVSFMFSPEQSNNLIRSTSVHLNALLPSRRTSNRKTKRNIFDCCGSVWLACIGGLYL